MTPAAPFSNSTTFNRISCMIYIHTLTMVLKPIKTRQNQSTPPKIQLTHPRKSFTPHVWLVKHKHFTIFPNSLPSPRCPVVPLAPGPVWHQRVQMGRCASGTRRLVQRAGSHQSQKYGGFLQWGSSQIISLNRIFLCKPSILATPPIYGNPYVLMGI